jgi:hypothetical protein
MKARTPQRVRAFSFLATAFAHIAFAKFFTKHASEIAPRGIS